METHRWREPQRFTYNRAAMRSPAAANLAKLYALRFLFWSHFIAAVLIPFYRDWGGISFAQILFLNSWFMLWNFLLEVPTGTVADFFGRRVSLILGPLVQVVAVSIYASVPDFRVFLVGEVLMAVAMTLISGADEALAYDSLRALGKEASATRVLARLESAKLAGIVSGALGGGVIAALWGVRAPMLCSAVPAALCVVLAYTLHEVAGDAPAAPRPRYVDLLRAGFRYFAGHAQLRRLAADLVSVAALTWMIIWLYQPALEQAGFDQSWFGPVHACLCLAQIAVLHRVEWLSARLGSRARYLALSTFVPGVSFVVLAYSDHPLATLAAVLSAAGFGLSRTPVLSAEMNRSIPSSQRATVLSVISMCRTLAIAAVNLVVGGLADRSVAAALGFVGAALLLVALAGVWARRPSAAS